MSDRIEQLDISIQSVLPAAFDDELSLVESVAKINDKVNELVDEVNDNYSTGLIPLVLEDIEDVDFSAQTGNGTQLNGRLDKWEQRIIDTETNIGNRTYTEQNYVTNGETVTASLDAIDTTVASQLADKPSYNETYLKQNGININDLDEQTRQTFLELNGIDVNYILGPGNVKPENTSFFNLGKNLFDKNNVELDKFVNSTNGDLDINSTYNATDFIPVIPNTTYISTSLYHGAYYDNDKIYISGISGNPFTTPVNAKYIRLTVKKSDMDIFQVEKGSFKTPYEPYRYNINPDYLPDILDKSIEPKMTTFIEIGKNKFNKDDVTTGKYVNNVYGYLSNNASYSASGFIEIKPSTEYISTAGYALAFYDKDYIFLSGLPAEYPQPLTTPSNAKFVRLSVPNVLLDGFQFEEGIIRTDYQPFGYVLKDGLYTPLTSSSDFKGKVVLPPTINSIIGKEVNIYFDNIMNDKAEKYDIDVVCNIGKQQNDRWTCVPDSAGNYPITIKVYSDTGLVSETTSSIIVKSDSVGTGMEKNILIIGDSTTANGITVSEVNNLFSSDVMDINLIGTQGVSPNLHEGRSGWTTENYYTGVTSPFVFSGLFDFGQYLTTNSLPVPDAVIINLGINDVFSFVADVFVLSKVATMLSQYNAIISNIKTVTASAKIGLAVTIPPNYYQDGFGEDYSNGQTRWRYKRNNFLWIDALIEEFAGKESSNIYLIPINTNLDTKNNFGKVTEAVNSRNTTEVIRSAANSGVHPATTGYNQIADVYYYWIKSLY